MSKMNDDFIVSAQNGDLGSVQMLLKQGADVHADNDAAFMAAFAGGNEKLLRLLFNHEKSSGRAEQWDFDRSLYWFYRISGMDTPEYLPREGGKRNGTEFDANLYFLVLPHLSMKEGYVLDYTYLYYYQGGEPALFARPVDAKRYWSDDDWSKWAEKNHYLDYVVADGSPESYLEFVLLSTMGSHFYLFWHAQYMDTSLITPASVGKHVKDIFREFYLKKDTGRQKNDLEILRPEVKLTDDIAMVTCCTFSEWKGIVRHRNSYNRLFPHKVVDREETTLVEYDSGIDI